MFSFFVFGLFLPKEKCTFFMYSVTIQVQGSKVPSSMFGVMKIIQFEEIQAWQLARELTKKVYKYLKKYEERKINNSEP